MTESEAGPRPVLPAGVVRETAAPDRFAVVWAKANLDHLSGTLLDTGLITMRVDPAETEPLVEVSGAPTLLLVEADVLDEAVLGHLGRFRLLSPQTRVCLLAGAATGPAGLLAALRAGLSEVLDPTDPGAVLALVDTTERHGARERILAVGAHPDDVEIGCGATLLRHHASGEPVSILTPSRGAVGGPSEARRSEAAGAAIRIGAELLMADLPDTRMEDAHEMVGLIEGVIAAVRPTTVYVHSEADSHQDHRAVHRATLIAARRVPQVFCYQSPSSRNGFAPTKFVPVDTTIDGKVEVLASYRSQSTRHYLEPDLVVASARYWARQLPHARYAEPFEVVRASDHPD